MCDFMSGLRRSDKQVVGSLPINIGRAGARRATQTAEELGTGLAGLSLTATPCVNPNATSTFGLLPPNTVAGHVQQEVIAVGSQENPAATVHYAAAKLRKLSASSSNAKFIFTILLNALREQENRSTCKLKNVEKITAKDLALKFASLSPQSQADFIGWVAADVPENYSGTFSRQEFIASFNKSYFTLTLQEYLNGSEFKKGCLFLLNKFQLTIDADVAEKNKAAEHKAKSKASLAKFPKPPKPLTLTRR